MKDDRARCPRCGSLLRFESERYRTGWHTTRVICRECHLRGTFRHGLPLCPRCGRPMKPLSAHTGGDNGIWVDAGYQCDHGRCPEVRECRGRRTWTIEQLEGYHRARTKGDKRARAEERRKRRAERLRAQMNNNP